MSDNPYAGSYPHTLRKISQLDGSNYSKMPIKRYILAGCFDVYNSFDDDCKNEKEAVEYLRSMKEAGLIINHPYRKDGSIHHEDCWFLTEKGKEFLDSHKDKF